MIITLDPIVPVGVAPGTIQWGTVAGGRTDACDVKVANYSNNALKLGIAGAYHWLEPWMANKFPANCAQHLSYEQTAISSVASLPAGSTPALIVTLSFGEELPGIYPVPLYGTLPIDVNAASLLADQITGLQGGIGLAADSGHVHPAEKLLLVGPSAGDNAPRIQAAIDSLGTGALASQGGEVELGPGSWGIASPIHVRSRVRLKGCDRDVCTLIALAGFPVNSELVRLGVPGDPTLLFACSAENLTIDCNSIAGSIGGYSERINEESGFFRVLVQNFMAQGILIQYPGSGGPAQHYSIDDVELIVGAATPATAIGLQVNPNGITAQPRVINRVSVVGTAANPLNNGMVLDGAPCLVSNLHFEHCTTGCLVGFNVTCAGAVFANVNGGPAITTLLVWATAGGTADGDLVAEGLVAITGGPFNLLNDGIAGHVINGFALGFYAIGHGGASRSVVSTDPAIVGKFTAGVGPDTVGHNHSHSHTSATHLHGHGGTHSHAQLWGNGTTGPASAGTAHTHGYNDPNGPFAGSGINTAATAPGNTDNATPGATGNDATGESATHTHKG